MPGHVVRLCGALVASMSDLDKSNLARAVFTSIGNASRKNDYLSFTKEKSVRTLIAVGGVMSNSLLRHRMEALL